MVACSSKPDAPDAGMCNGVKELDCNVTVTCAGVPSPASVVLCDKSNDAQMIEQRADMAIAAETSCSGGEVTFAATCTAAPTAITCPEGFELEDSTVCIPGMPYDADTSGICGNLPQDAGACSFACNRTALYAFAVDGKFTTYTCPTADMKRQFIVGAAPMIGDGSR
jgi:hypothetical protein